MVMISEHCKNLSRAAFKAHIDSVSYSDPDWEVIRHWNNEQVALIRDGKRPPLESGTTLLNAFYDEVLHPGS